MLNPATSFLPCQVGWSVNARGVARVSCKRWNCQHCGPRKLRRMLKRINGVRYRQFLTIAVKQSTDIRDDLDLLSRAWNSLSRWLKRNYNRGHYAWTTEDSRRGTNVHRHIVLDCDHIPHRQLMKAAARCGLTAQIKVKRIYDQEPLLHYITKSCTKIRLPRYKRRIQTSVRAEPKVRRGTYFTNDEFAALPGLDTAIYRLTPSPTPAADLEMIKAIPQFNRLLWSDMHCRCGYNVAYHELKPLLTPDGELFFLAACDDCYQTADLAGESVETDPDIPYLLKLRLNL